LIAGINPVAVDVIAGEIAGFPNKLLYVERVAERLSIDGADRSAIQTAGISPQEAKIRDFRLPHQSDVQWGLPPFLKNRLRHYCTSRPFAVPEKCRLCGICRDACPPGAIEIKDGSLHVDYNRCIRCFCCRELCPHAALDVRDGPLIRLMKKYI
jgi:ferredoxin